MVRGATAMAGVTLVTKLVATLGQLVIAAFVLEGEYGLWGLAISLADTFGFVQKLGLREVLTYRQKSVDEWISSAVWAAGAGGLMTLLIVLAVAPFTPTLFDSSPGLVAAFIVLGFGATMQGFIEVFQTRLALDFRFGYIAKVSVTEGVVRIIFQVLLSILGMGAFGLVLVRAVTYAGEAVAYGVAARPKVMRRPQLLLWKKALPDSSMIFTTRVAEVGIRRGDVMLLGIFASDAVVGVYFLAFGLSTQVVMLLAQGLIGVLSAGLSKLQDDEERLRRAFFSVVRQISFIGVPLLVVQSATCAQLLRFLYLDKWESAIVPLQILSVQACFILAGWNVAAVFTARGLFKRQTVIKVSGGVSFLAIMVWSASTGSPVIVALAALAFRLLYVPIQIAFATSGGWNAVSETVLAVLKPFNVAGASALAALLLVDAAEPIVGSVASLAGEQSYRAEQLLELILIASVTMLLYWVGAKTVLRSTFEEFAARIKPVLPAGVLKLVPSWVF